MRFVILILWCVLFAVSATAQPTLSASNTESGVQVVVQGLEADRTYWLTMVPPETENGGYTSFEYVSGTEEASALLSEPQPGVPMEVRLHERVPGNPLLARIMLDPAPEEAAPQPDARTINFAKVYGLAGEWRGEMSCAQGRARFDVTLRPHFYENGYLGDLHLTLVDGPDAGATGVWPLTAQLTPQSGAVGLSADTPLSVPVEGYGVPQIFGALLSKDGLRIENAALQSQTCTDFSFERVLLPTIEEAQAEAERLRAEGVLGQWAGSYECGAEMALELSIDTNPVNGLTLANWVYRGVGANAFEGEATFRIQAVGPGQVALNPLKWVKQPYRHQALPVTFNIAPDGAAMQGLIEGCGPMTVARRGAAPTGQPTQVLSAAEMAELATFAGRWTGVAQCGDTRQVMQIDLPNLSTGETAAELRYVASTGVDAATHLVLRAEPGDPIQLSLLETIASKLNQPVHLPSELALGEDSLNMSFAEGCNDLALGRDRTPPAYAALPGNAGQDAVLVPEGETAIRIAEPARICRALADWSGILSPSEARMTRAGRRVSHPGRWPTLFTDDLFEPVFGMRYETLSASPELGEALLAPLRKTCGDLGVDDLSLRTALSLAFSAEPNSDRFGSSTQMFQRAIAEAETARSSARQLAEAIAAATPDAVSAERVAKLRADLDTVSLLEAEQAALGGSLDRLDVQIAALEEQRFLSDLAGGATAATVQTLTRAAALVEREKPEARANWVEALDPVTSSLAERIEADPEMDLLALDALRIFPSIDAAITEANDARRRAADARMAELRERIDGIDRIVDLRPVLTEITQSGSDMSVLARYDEKARNLLQTAVGDVLEATDTSGNIATSDGALSGLRRNALLTAFMAGDRLVPYRADRDGTMLYLQRLTAVFREYCPAALPPDLPNRIAGHFIDLQAVTGSRDQMAQLGFQAIIEGLNMLANPGQAMAGAMRQDEIFAMADGDAQILLNNLDCTGPQLRRLFENARVYVVEPRKGVPSDLLKMEDVCMSALNDGMQMNDTRAYCVCAGAELDRASPELQVYLRNDPKARFRQISLLDRQVDRSIRSCRR